MNNLKIGSIWALILFAIFGTYFAQQAEPRWQNGIDYTCNPNDLRRFGYFDGCNWTNCYCDRRGTRTCERTLRSCAQPDFTTSAGLRGYARRTCCTRSARGGK
ncbi:hypothetical protein Fcan01_10681 [Folsomia candida]|uniref:Uncharacterized protein n=1 Tax=Folsomia candida TaxID=158441 RepID=A0A226EBP8_FOLCA|nr:hypothetical protein Fcan01_10681 [Folsomia candida]